MNTGAGMSMSGDATVVTRTCVPTSRASSTVPSTVRVAMSSGALRLEMSYMVRAAWAPNHGDPAWKVWALSSLKTSNRSPEKNTFRAVVPGRVFCRVSLPPAELIRCTRPWATATIRRPSVLTMSGSSTPVSWMFVSECSGALPADAAPADAAESASAGIGTLQNGSPAPPDAAIPPLTRSIRSSGAWSL